MGKETGISWTDHTFNPWWGCTKVSLGCDNCYAEAFDKRVGGAHWGKGQPRRTFGEKHWDEPYKWDRAAEKAGEQAKVFCASMADVMDDEAPEGERERLWKLINATPNLIWQLLTKRPQRFGKYLPEFFGHNVWLGITAENQEFFDVRWPHLLNAVQHHGCVSFVSYEPAVGALSLTKAFALDNESPDWLIFGGETGNGRRECDVEWAKAIQEECRILEVSFFMKQMSARTPTEAKSLIPITLNVQEFPGERGAGEITQCC